LAGRIKEECWQIMSEPGALSVAGFSCMIWVYVLVFFGFIKTEIVQLFAYLSHEI
jgi:hypothetical protein